MIDLINSFTLALFTVICLVESIAFGLLDMFAKIMSEAGCVLVVVLLLC